MSTDLLERPDTRGPANRKRETDALLYLDDLRVTFDGYKALRGLSLTLARGELRAIIGPNGAGKTTMMDCITGKTRPDSGIALFDGSHDLLRSDEPAIADLGIGRKFQKPTVFESHTVRDNLLLALAGLRNWYKLLLAQPTKAEKERLDEILTIVRMTDQQHLPAARLSHGQKQWLEIGMLLMQEPELLMLDEPIAGMSARERELTAELLQRICRNRSVIVIEHDMEFVARIAHKVTVMHQGKILAEGPMDKVQADPKVIDVYLGH